MGVDNGGISKTQKLNFGSFTDGLSNTLQLTESAGRPDVYRNGKKVLTATGTNRVNGGGWCRPASELFLLRGSSPDGLTFPGPNAINATNGEVLGAYPHPFYNTDGTGHIYGFHTGGVNALYGDGSVRFLKSSTGIAVLAAHSHPQWRRDGHRGLRTPVSHDILPADVGRTIRRVLLQRWITEDVLNLLGWVVLGSKIARRADCFDSTLSPWKFLSPEWKDTL